MDFRFLQFLLSDFGSKIICGHYIGITAIRSFEMKTC